MKWTPLLKIKEEGIAQNPALNNTDTLNLQSESTNIKTSERKLL